MHAGSPHAFFRRRCNEGHISKSIKNAKFLVFPCLLSSFLVSAQTVDALIDWGRVNMQGAIIVSD